MGNVVGSGPHARAVIRLLHDAARKLSSAGLPPDEFLEHLDHLATRWGEGPDGRLDCFRGATCLYAIYDPVSRHWVASRAGYRPPAVIGRDDWVDFPDVPAGSPLVLGSGPFATAEWEVTEGVQLVLYGHGLTERRRGGADAGLALLRGALSRAAARTDVVGPEETCAAVLDALLPVRSGGAVALLVHAPAACHLIRSRTGMCPQSRRRWRTCALRSRTGLGIGAWSTLSSRPS